VKERLDTLDVHGLKLYQVTIKMSIAPDQPPYDPKLKEVLPLLAGRGVQLLPLISGMAPSDPAGDPRAVEILREAAELAARHGVEILLYPHTNDWLERIEDAVRVAEKVDRPNVGVMFNLCHWLRADGAHLRARLEQALPHLRAVSIHGADTAAEVQAGTGNWIQPLGQGSYDVAALLALLEELGFEGRVGLQCWGIAGDARQHLAQSMAAWRGMMNEQAAGHERPGREPGGEALE
jgi:sugar phosphate isomerase/epimerase